MRTDMGFEVRCKRARRLWCGQVAGKAKYRTKVALDAQVIIADNLKRVCLTRLIQRIELKSAAGRGECESVEGAAETKRTSPKHSRQVGAA